MAFHDLSKRLVTSFLSFAVIASILIFAYQPFVKWGVTLVIALLGGVGLWEYGKLTKIDQKKGFVPLLIVIAILEVFAFSLSLSPLTIPVLGLIFIFFYHFNKISGAIQSISMGFFGFCYVVIPLGLLLKILYLSSAYKVGEEGRMWLLYLLIVTKITDVGAYFGGRLFGCKKLAPNISPGKTIVGAAIGFISAIVASIIFYVLGFYLDHFNMTFIQSIWLGALLGCLGQIGDLAESLLKRDADVKDSNKLPGLGGVLDMVDSLLFTTPIIYLFLYN